MWFGVSHRSGQSLFIECRASPLPCISQTGPHSQAKSCKSGNLPHVILFFQWFSLLWFLPVFFSPVPSIRCSYILPRVYICYLQDVWSKRSYLAIPEGFSYLLSHLVYFQQDNSQLFPGILFMFYFKHHLRLIGYVEVDTELQQKRVR